MLRTALLFGREYERSSRRARRPEYRKRQTEQSNVAEDTAANATPAEEIVHEVGEETIDNEEPVNKEAIVSVEISTENVKVIETEPYHKSDDDAGNEVAAAPAIIALQYCQK